MSVLRNKRNISKAEYVKCANEICVETLAFLTKLSTKYSRLLSAHVAKLALEVIEHTEKANSIMPSDEQKKHIRRAHLLEARASLMALDIELARCYEILSRNPSAAMDMSKAEGAQHKLDAMAQSIGEKIDLENDMIKKIMKSDAKR